MRGRPSKYTPEAHASICDRLRAGCTRRAAQQSVGIDDNTFYRWLEKPGFRDAVVRAEADAETRATVALVKGFSGADGDWRAAESWLKRRRRDDWGDKVDFGKFNDEDLIAEAKKLFGGTLEEILAAPIGGSPHES